MAKKGQTNKRRKVGDAKEEQMKVDSKGKEKEHLQIDQDEENDDGEEKVDQEIAAQTSSNKTEQGAGEEEPEEEEDVGDDRLEATKLSTMIDSDGRYRNKQRCLALCTRGVTARYRHLLEDLRSLMPHHKKESKLDPGDEGLGRAVRDIAEMRSCNTVLVLECRKRQDCYLWLGRIGRPDGSSASGPSVKFHVSNVHTMDELKLTGNCMKGSRPILNFDESFGRIGHLKLLKELFVEIFGIPRGHPKSKPFVDRVMSFYYADKRIWVRNYQIVEQAPTNALELHQTKKETGQAAATSLVEIGPRFVLNPIRIFRGLFGGQTLYQNPDFVSPNQIRALQRKDKGHRYEDRKMAQKKRKERESERTLPEDPLDSVFREG